MPRVGRSIRVSGRVQGVFFRAWTREQARSLGIDGWVRNCPDGTVEAHLAGEEEAVERMVELVRRGPPHAVVDQAKVEDAAPEDFSGFDIRS
jgi:acylphosphatase